MSTLRVELDQATCCGSKMCVNLAPQAFELLNDGFAGVVRRADEVPLDVLKKAARSCPTQCIVIYRDDIEVDLY